MAPANARTLRVCIQMVPGPVNMQTNPSPVAMELKIPREAVLIE